MDTDQGFSSASVRHSQAGRLKLEVAATSGDQFHDDGDDIDRRRLVQGARQPNQYGAVFGVDENIQRNNVHPRRHGPGPHGEVRHRLCPLGRTNRLIRRHGSSLMDVAPVVRLKVLSLIRSW
jgi:hypothetical protein